ncbi:MAG TPA: YibE/F family protein [Anaerovoracaceae bacterium]|nr:YibE/F family protein [Anaerovoracaceae bacterium]
MGKSGSRSKSSGTNKVRNKAAVFNADQSTDRGRPVVNANQSADKGRSKNLLIWIIIALLAAAFLIGVYLLNLHWHERWATATSDIQYVRAKVLDVTAEDLTLDEALGLYRGSQNLKIEILSGERTGEVFEVQNMLNPAYHVLVKKGMTVVVSLFENDGNVRVDVFSHDRLPYYLLALAFFLGAMVLICGKKGFKSAIGLTFTLLCILYLFLPMMFLGFSPVLSVILLGVIVSLVTLVLLNGFGRKTLAAILGTVSGVAIAGGSALIMGWLANISIYHSQDAETIMVLARNFSIKPQGILFAGVIIAALGAVMDVAMSISSSVWELAGMGKDVSRKRLFASGMNVARDTASIMANTLILAFVGSSVTLTVILFVSNIPFMRLINSDLLAIEILQAISGTLGILSAAPITAYISAVLFEKMH